MITQDELIEKKLDELYNSSLNKLSDEDISLIRKAFDFSYETYKNDFLPDGSPYIFHNINIAITAFKEIGLGTTSAVCSLLHGERTKDPKTLEVIKHEFGGHVAEIIEGFNKLSDLSTERISYQSDTFRKLFLSLVNDMRVILIKLAHRLNDIRNIGFLGEKKQSFIDEIKHLYIPIAHRLGLYNVKTELEEGVMLYEMPEEYDAIDQKIKETKKKREVFIKDFIWPVERELIAQRINAKIKWRTKSIPSIFHKMVKAKVEFEEVFDLFAIRIIIDTSLKNEKRDCWRVYSIVSNFYQPKPDRLRDWITTPKASGYESLHSTVLSTENKWVEVQIRTERMDQIAEKGQAAHWHYKDTMGRGNFEGWLTQVRDILQNQENVVHDNAYRSNGEKHEDTIFVFTPKGDLKQLPKGSTVLDFAYEIHSDVGATCSGAKIGAKAVPIRYILKNGDKVSIITSKNQKPKLDWLAFVETDKARTRIKRQLKEEKYREAELGKEILMRKMKNWKIKSSEDLISVLVNHYKLDTGIDLHYLIAKEKIDLADIKKQLSAFTETENAPKKPDTPEVKQEEKAPDYEQLDILYIGDNLKNIDYRLAKCCNPIPGDNVFGFVTTTGGFTIHRKTCPNAKTLLEKYPYRALPIKWIQGDNKSFSMSTLKISGKDELGIVSAITRIITDDLRVNMRSVNFTKKGNNFVGVVSVMIKNFDHLAQLVAKINLVKGVEKVVRVK